MGLQGRTVGECEEGYSHPRKTLRRQSKLVTQTGVLDCENDPLCQWDRSAVHYASAGGNTSVVLHLRNVGLDINAKDEVRATRHCVFRERQCLRML